MSKAEERAQDLGYGTDPLNRAEYTENEVRNAFIDGYNEAEKDLELTWEDIEAIDQIFTDVFKDGFDVVTNKYYQEVLNRFNNYGKKKV